MPQPPENAAVWIGFGLFFASEAIGASRLRSNYLLELALHIAMELFPYELQRRDAPTRKNRPRLKRDSRGRYVARD